MIRPARVGLDKYTILARCVGTNVIIGVLELRSLLHFWLGPTYIEICNGYVFRAILFQINGLRRSYRPTYSHSENTTWIYKRSNCGIVRISRTDLSERRTKERSHFCSTESGKSKLSGRYPHRERNGRLSAASLQTRSYLTFRVGEEFSETVTKVERLDPDLVKTVQTIQSVQERPYRNTKTEADDRGSIRGKSFSAPEWSFYQNSVRVCARKSPDVASQKCGSFSGKLEEPTRRCSEVRCLRSRKYQEAPNLIRVERTK